MEQIKSLKAFLIPFYKDTKKNSKKWMRGSEFASDSVELLYHKLHKISLRRGKSYIDSPRWLKNKKALINPKNCGGNCF